MRKFLGMGCCIVLLLTVVRTALAEPITVTGCEIALKDRLDAKSGYVRVGFSQLAQQLSRQAVVKYIDTVTSFSPKLHTAMLEAFDSGKIHPQRYIVFLNYMISDANGLPSAATAKCEYIANQNAEDKGTLLKPDTFSIADFKTIN